MHIKRLKVILLVSSLVSLALLVLSAYEENIGGQWRVHQTAYREVAIARAGDESLREASSAMPIAFKQVFLPALDRVDRCVTCHVGIDDPRMAGAELPIGAHSGDVFKHHPLDKFGCTVCHDGQGRAVDKAAAHGEVAHWGNPLLRGERVYTSCSRCHHDNDLYGAQQDLYARGDSADPLDQGELAGALPGVANPRDYSIARGKQLVLRSGCLGCHTYRGRGGSLGPDITYVGDKTVHDFDFQHVTRGHTVAQWLFEHFKAPAAVSPNSLMPDARLTDGQAWDLTHYMLSLHRKTMPADFTPVPPRRQGTPVSGAQLYAMFCNACHGKNGQGSTVREHGVVRAVDAPAELMVPSLNNPDTLAVAGDDYLRSIVHHGRTGTTMIAWSGARNGGLRDDEIDRIVGYIRSWQPPAPDADAIAASRGAARAGRALYTLNCSACHGPNGEGGIGNVLNSVGFLAVASDEYLAASIINGRPNTAMPGWRQLDSQQISDLLALMRSWNPVRNDRPGVLALLGSAKPDRVSAEIGNTLYLANCAMCHGRAGQGDLAPSLATQEFLTVVGNDYLYETIAHGRPGTGMPAWHHLSNEDVASLLLHLRTWQKEPDRKLSTRTIDGDWDAGRFLYTGLCVGCHGDDAEGGVGPQLNNPVFLRTATDQMLREWIAHGKVGTAMRAFVKGEQGTAELRDSQIDDLVAYVRSLSRRPRVPFAKRPSGRPELGRMWFAVSCAGCHGDDGEGASGPSLANPEFLRVASDGFLMATMALGRDGTEMRPVKKGAQSILTLDSDQVNDLVAYLRSLEHAPRPGIPHRYVVPWDLARGRKLYGSNCAGCHGINGKAELSEPGRLSAWAPELNNKSFLAAATDGFLQATIARGRTGTAMRPFGHGAQGLVDLTTRDIDDIVAYIRRWSGQTGLPITIPAERKNKQTKTRTQGE